MNNKFQYTKTEGQGWLVEKPEMEKPDENNFYEYNPEPNVGVIGFDIDNFKKACAKYENHLASLRRFKYDYPDPGKEMELGKDFEVVDDEVPVNGDYANGTSMVAIPIKREIKMKKEPSSHTNLCNCYNKYISLLAEELFQFRKLAKEIHKWSSEDNLEKKVKALGRLETDFYELSITPESNEIINTRKDLSEAIALMPEVAIPITQRTYSEQDLLDTWDAAIDRVSHSVQARLRVKQQYFKAKFGIEIK